MNIIQQIRNELLRLDERLAEPGRTGGYGFVIQQHSGPFDVFKQLSVASGKLEDISGDGPISRYPGFSLANAFDRFVSEQVESVDHVVFTRLYSNKLEAFDSLSGSFAGQYDNNHDDPHWEEIEEHKDRIKKNGDAKFFEIDIFNVYRRSRDTVLSNIWFAAFKESAAAAAVALKLRLS